MTWPAVVIWILIAAAFLMRGPRALFYLFYATGAIGTLVMVPGSAVGGINLLPQSFCALFFLLKLLLRNGAAARVILLATNIRDLGVLSLFLVWSLFSAYVMPRVFMGLVNVIPIVAVVADPQPLTPSGANFTQAAYMILSAGLVFFCAVAARNSEFRRDFLRANLLTAVLLILTGLLDLATQGTNLLAPFRNANYALLTDVEVLGSKRVVGLMPEASTYGAACVSVLSVLLFLRTSFEAKLQKFAVPGAILGLLVMTIMSTSSTGYVGLGVLATTYSANLLWRLHSSNPVSRRGVFSELAILTVLAVVVVVVVVASPTLFNPLADLVDLLVFQKTASSSYIERAGWTRYAWEAFLATGGWGVGLGGARASNWYYSILSNTGFVGAALLSIFLIQTFLRQPAERGGTDANMLSGLKFSLVPNLVMAGLSGTTPDIGPQNGVVYGLITAISISPGTNARLSSSNGGTRDPLLQADG